MRQARPGGSPLVIELAGLPGAGKTSLTRAVRVPHAGRGEIGLLEGRLGRSAWPAAMAALRLALSIRPLRPYSLLRVLKLIVALRNYGVVARPLVILDQGLIQKLWSMLIETRSFSADRLEAMVKTLAPFAADHLVWVSVPPALAAERIVNLRQGNSRFDGRPLAEVSQRLEHLEDTYQLIVDLFAKHAQLKVLALNGRDAIATNAEKIDRLLKLEYGFED